MARKLPRSVKFIVTAAAAIAALVVGVIFLAIAYVSSSGDETRWSVRLMKDSGLENFIGRRAQGMGVMQAWRLRHQSDEALRTNL